MTSPTPDNHGPPAAMPDGPSRLDGRHRIADGTNRSADTAHRSDARRQPADGSPPGPAADEPPGTPPPPGAKRQPTDDAPGTPPPPDAMRQPTDETPGGPAAVGDPAADRRPPADNSPGRLTATGRRVVAVALAVSGVAYASWVLGDWINPALDPMEAYASELAATDQPWSGLFRAGDLVAGAAACFAGLRSLRRRPWLGWACVAAFGLFTILDAGLFSMVCAPSVDATCAAAEVSGGLPLRHHIHTLTSTLAATAPFVGLLVFAWVWRTVGAWVLAGLMIAATAATMATVVTERFVGFNQRLQLVVVSAWLLWLAVRTWRDDRDAPREVS